VGSSISDRTLTSTKLNYTYILKSGNDLNYYPRNADQFNLNLEFFYALNKTIIEKKVKGLVIGYPLVNNKPVRIKFI
jgi:hypothetical protein